MAHPAAEPEGMVNRPVVGMAHQRSRFSNRSILNRILRAVAAAIGMMKKVTAIEVAEPEDLTDLPVWPPAAAQVEQKAEVTAATAPAAMHLSMVPEEAEEVLDIGQMDLTGPAPAAPVTRASSISASRWTRAFLTDEEGSICALQ